MSRRFFQFDYSFQCNYVDSHVPVYCYGLQQTFTGTENEDCLAVSCHLCLKINNFLRLRLLTDAVSNMRNDDADCYISICNCKIKCSLLMGVVSNMQLRMRIASLSVVIMSDNQ